MENYLLSPLIYAEVKPKSIFLGIYENTGRCAVKVDANMFFNVNKNAMISV
jgi:hypothetical protein